MLGDTLQGFTLRHVALSSSQRQLMTMRAEGAETSVRRQGAPLNRGRIPNNSALPTSCALHRTRNYGFYNLRSALRILVGAIWDTTERYI